jgi:hypothetical protein
MQCTPKSQRLASNGMLVNEHEGYVEVIYAPTVVDLAGEQYDVTGLSVDFGQASVSPTAPVAPQPAVADSPQTTLPRTGKWTEEHVNAWLHMWQASGLKLNTFEMNHGIPHAKLARWAKKRGVSNA